MENEMTRLIDQISISKRQVRSLEALDRKRMTTGTFGNLSIPQVKAIVAAWDAIPANRKSELPEAERTRTETMVVEFRTFLKTL
jgi:hypothetical protein